MIKRHYQNILQRFISSKDKSIPNAREKGWRERMLADYEYRASVKAMHQSDVAFIMAFFSKAPSHQALTTATAIYLQPVNQVPGR